MERAKNLLFHIINVNMAKTPKIIIPLNNGADDEEEIRSPNIQNNPPIRSNISGMYINPFLRFFIFSLNFQAIFMVIAYYKIATKNMPGFRGSFLYQTVESKVADWQWHFRYRLASR